MSVSEKAKAFGEGALGIGILAGIFLLGLAFLFFAAELSVWALQWLPNIFAITVLAVLIILIPMAFIPATRYVSSIGFHMCGQIFALMLLIFSMAYVYSEWGLLPVIIGLFLAGIGPIPIAVFIAIIEGHWPVLGNLAVIVVAAIVASVLASFVARKAEERAFRKAEEESKAKNAIPARRID